MGEGNFIVETFFSVISGYSSLPLLFLSSAFFSLSNQSSFFFRVWRGGGKFSWGIYLEYLWGIFGGFPGGLEFSLKFPWGFLGVFCWVSLGGWSFFGVSLEFLWRFCGVLGLSLLLPSLPPCLMSFIFAYGLVYVQDSLSLSSRAYLSLDFVHLYAAVA